MGILGIDLILFNNNFIDLFSLEYLLYNNLVNSSILSLVEDSIKHLNSKGKINFYLLSIYSKTKFPTSIFSEVISLLFEFNIKFLISLNEVLIPP